jgi:O-antigen/teichoic acid export membrane protein
MATVSALPNLSSASVAEPNPMTGTGRGVRTVGQTILARTTIQGLNAVTGILTARLLLPAGRGELAAMILWSSFLAGLTTFGLPSALIYHIRNRPQQTGNLVLTAVFMTVIVSCIAGAGGALWMPYWLHQFPLWVIRAAQWFLVVTPLCSLALVLRGALEARGAFSLSNLAQVLNPAVTLVLLVLFWIVHRFDTMTASCAYIFAVLPVFALLAWQTRKLVAHHARASLAAGRLLLSYGFRSWGVDLLGTLALQIDQVIVVRYLTPSDLGIYVVMLSLSRMLNVFQASVVQVLFPKAAGHTRETAIAMTLRAARVTTLITGTGAAIIGLIGPQLLRLFYGAEYAQSIGSLRLLLAEATISGCVYVLSQAFMALGRPGIVTFRQVTGLALSIPLMLVLIPRWGIGGAAFALLISTCARFVFIFVSFRTVLKTRLPNLLPRGGDMDILLRGIRGLKRTEEA